MGLLRWIVLGGAGYIAWKANGRAKAPAAAGHTFDGLSATFAGREQADLAIEHLVQEHGVERATIFVEPVNDENTAGTTISGGDAPSGRPVDDDRSDAPLRGALKLSVAATPANRAVLHGVLEEAGATSIEAY